MPFYTRQNQWAKLKSSRIHWIDGEWICGPVRFEVGCFVSYLHVYRLQALVDDLLEADGNKHLGSTVRWLHRFIAQGGVVYVRWQYRSFREFITWDFWLVPMLFWHLFVDPEGLRCNCGEEEEK